MAQWSDGYTSDIGYTFGSYPEMSPVSLYWSLVCAGVKPSFDPARVTYCELGFGQGISLLTNAAANPRSEFWGTDFMPSQAAGAFDLAREGRLENVHLFDDSFRAFGDRDLPQFDIIAMHGVLSWVSPENQQILVEFLRRHLKVGGVVYVSYNTLPGWAPLMPLRHLFAGRLLGDAGVGKRLEDGLWLAEQLEKLGAGYFQNNTKAVEHLESLASHRRNYLVHEYLNEQWQPLYHADVAQMLESAKLDFATSARPAEQLDGLTVPDAAREMMARAVGPVERETLRDYFTNVKFRRDIFVRGAIATQESEAVQLVRRTRFALVTPPSEIPRTAQLPGAELSMHPSLYDPLFAALAEGPATLQELSTRPELSKVPFNTLFQALVILTSVRHASPCLEDSGRSERAEHCAALNQEILRRSEFGGGSGFLASPVAGLGVEVPRLHQMMRLGEQRGVDPTEFALQALRSRGECFLSDGQPIRDIEANRAIMRERFEEYATHYKPLQQALGVMG